MNFNYLITLFRQTHKELQTRAARSVDTALVVRNWLFGWYIVEYEQKGEDRAKYGIGLVRILSEHLTKSMGKGYSEQSIEQFRKFYLSYKEIPQTLSAKSLKPKKGEKIKSQTLPAVFTEDEARQKRFTFDEDHFYVDLVFYNRLLRCYVLIDLKRLDALNPFWQH